MGLQYCVLNLDAGQKELQPHGSLEFPCAGYLERPSDWPDDIIPWHWHEELEVMLVTSGALRVQVPGAAYTLAAGDCIAVNSGVLHSAAAQPQCELHSMVFSPLLLTGSADSVFAKKYLTPLTGCRAFRACLLDRTANRAQIDGFARAFDALSQDAPEFEFTVREALSALCCALFRQFENAMAGGETPRDQDEMRMRKMLELIREQYREPLTLSRIAKAADVGERECLRCFGRTIQVSPMQYLLKYRVMRGAERLLQKPAESVSEIALNCGFDSPSNFSRMFRRFYGRTPREYRAAAPRS
jgi:AraC-like DNA-binding protein